MLNPKLKVAFIGGGNMAKSILSGLIEHGHSPNHIMVCTPTESNRVEIEKTFRVHVDQSNKKAISFADVIILAVKPHMVVPVCEALREEFLRNNDQNILMSIAAGINTEEIRLASGNSRVICAMPNLPAAIGKGLTGLYADKKVAKKDINQINGLMSAVGETIWIDNPSQMPSIVAAAGSSPAYFYLFMEAMKKSAIAQGLPADQAHEAVMQSALGAVSLAKQNGTSFNQLRRQVTSPNGTTEQGIKSFIQRDIEGIVGEAMEKVANRCRELEQNNNFK
jgi:pyrroline-5-carboxylate reductase